MSEYNVRKIVIKDEWASDKITISEASKLCTQIESGLNWIKSEKSNLHSFYRITQAAYGIIDNPYDKMYRQFLDFEHVFSVIVDGFKDAILQYTEHHFTDKKKPEVKLYYFIRKSRVQKSDFYVNLIKKFNDNLDYYKIAENNKNQIFKKACRLKGTNWTMGPKYLNSDYSNTIAIIKDVREDEHIGLVFEIEEHKLCGWSHHTSFENYRFDDIKNSELYKSYLKEHYAEEFI